MALRFLNRIDPQTHYLTIVYNATPNCNQHVVCASKKYSFHHHWAHQLQKLAVFVHLVVELITNSQTFFLVQGVVKSMSLIGRCQREYCTHSEYLPQGFEIKGYACIGSISFV